MAGNTVRIGTQVTGVGKASSDLDRLRDKFERLQKQGAKGFAIGVGAAVTAKALDALSMAAGAAVQWIGDAVAKASDLNETLNKSQVVFGGAAEKVAAFGATAAGALGQSQNQAIAAAAEYGNLFKTIGLTESASADMSVALVKLASDLASFNNADPSETLAALKSGLIGEAEPMRRFGVLLNEAAVKAKAMELGLTDAKGQLSEAGKVQARYALILEQTTTAQGDFTRTAGGLANAQRIANAEMENAQAAIGQDLLPVQLELTKAMVVFAHVLKEDALPAVHDLADGLGPLADGLGLVGQASDATVGAWLRAKGAADELIHQNDIFRDRIAESARAAERGAEIWDRHMKPALQDVGFEAQETGAELRDTAKDTIWAAEKMGSVWEAMVPRFAGVKNRLTSLANEAAGAIYDPMIRAAELAANAREQAEQRVIIAQQRATDESKADYTDRVEDAKLRLLELEKAALAMQAEMVGAGEANAATITALTDKLQTAIATGSDEEVARIRALLAWLETLQTAAGKTADALTRIGSGVSRTTVTTRQHGGPVAANEPVLVGEKRPELFVPRSAGTILPRLPSAGVGRSMGASLSLTVNVTPSFGMTPATARAVGDAVGPAIYDYLFRRGAVART